MLIEIGHVGGLKEDAFSASWGTAIQKGAGIVCVEQDEAGNIAGTIGGTFLKDAFSQEPMIYTSFECNASNDLYWYFDNEAEKRGAKTIAIVKINGQKTTRRCLYDMGYEVSRVLTVWSRRLAA
jgi:hypothetical protein